MSNKVDAGVKNRKWLTLGLARAMLGINETTLRQWADHGLVRAFRTPGGHRRFSADDMNALIEESQQKTALLWNQRRPSADALLPRVRHRMAVMGNTAQIPSWMSGLQVADGEQMRAIGRELLELCADTLQPHRGKISAGAARRLGNLYAAELTKLEITLPVAIETFVFFRSITFETLKPMLRKQRLSSYDLSRCWTQVVTLTDQVLLSMTASFDSYAVDEKTKNRARKIMLKS